MTETEMIGRMVVEDGICEPMELIPVPDRCTCCGRGDCAACTLAMRSAGWWACDHCEAYHHGEGCPCTCDSCMEEAADAAE